jgi:hypothetical protein
MGLLGTVIDTLEMLREPPHAHTGKESTLDECWVLLSDKHNSYMRAGADWAAPQTPISSSPPSDS